jgi:hypothetical protein
MAPASPARPSRAVRLLIARIFALMFERGEMKTFYSTLNHITTQLIPFRENVNKGKPVTNDRESTMYVDEY